jgi:hypothetical protein
MLRPLGDAELSVVAAVLAAHDEVDNPAAVPAALVAALVGVGAVLIVRRIRRAAAVRRHVREQLDMDARLRALMDEHGGLFDRCLQAEAERGLRMLDRWRSTHSP